MKKIINEMKVRLPSHSENEAVARTVVSAFSALIDPTVEELSDLRCAVSEADDQRTGFINVQRVAVALLISPDQHHVLMEGDAA